ncbi:hypothetical protein NQZ68_018604 [Dissostichus eleginoides]|nr:hypothetical protein NQZ68_018604 [Dissostichus eleginoides]
MTDLSALILKMAFLLLPLLRTAQMKSSIYIHSVFPSFRPEAGAEGEITWLKDGEEIDEEKVKKLDETSSKLCIKNATMQDGPSFGSTDTYHEFLEGTDGIVPCLVMGQPAVDVHWLRDGEEILDWTLNITFFSVFLSLASGGKRVRRLPNNTVLIEKVKTEDAGTYVCKAQIKGRPVSQQLPISVVVNAPPSVRLREEVKKVLAGPETNVSLLCLVDGLPKPNITWNMPVTFDPSHHQFNSDNSQLTIKSVARGDYGEYICTATNKIANSTATIMLHVYEAPEVFVSAEQQSVSVGERVSVSCNVSGHPQPELHWLNKQNGCTLDSGSGRVRVEDGALVIDEVVPSDGGLYSCMAVSNSGNASRDVAIYTQPSPPHYVSVSPGPTSVLFSLKSPLVSGGTPITSFVLQWRQSAAEQWKEVTVPASDNQFFKEALQSYCLAINTLQPYTLYTVRLAALNAVGVGQFSDTNTVRTQATREPDRPVLSSDEMKVEGNTFSVPFKQIDDGGTPLLHFDLRYRKDKEETEWKEKQLLRGADSVTLRDLSYGSDYELEVIAVNTNGSSLPARFNFTIAEQPAKESSMTKGTMFGIVMVIFLVVFLVVDATCCYRNRCGLLMSISTKLFGQKVPGLKMLEDGEGTTNGEVKLNGLSTPRGSVQNAGVQTFPKEGGALPEITCDKASLTKHEKKPPGSDAADA